MTNLNKQGVDAADIDAVLEELGANCFGHPTAEIPWPHRVLNKAIETIEALRARCDQAEKVKIELAEHLGKTINTAADAVNRANSAEAEAAELRAELERSEFVDSGGRLYRIHDARAPFRQIDEASDVTPEAARFLAQQGKNNDQGAKVLAEERQRAEAAEAERDESNRELIKKGGLLGKAEAEAAQLRERVGEIISDMCSVAEDEPQGSHLETELYGWAKRLESAIEAECTHEWVDATNEVVTGGELCLRCHAIRPTRKEQ